MVKRERSKQEMKKGMKQEAEMEEKEGWPRVVLHVLPRPTPPSAASQGLTVVHGHRVDGRHRLWIASRVTVARLWIGRVGRVATGQDGWLPVAPLGWRARVQGVAVLIRRGGTGAGHGRSRAEGTSTAANSWHLKWR